MKLGLSLTACLFFVALVAPANPQSSNFPVSFVDVAAQAGLTHPVVYGGVETKNTSSRPTAAAWLFTIMTTMGGWICS